MSASVPFALRASPLLVLALGLGACTGDAPPDDAEAPEEAPAEATVEAPVSEGPDIWLADLTWTDGVPSVSNLRNATDRPGYDNQPFFFPDGSLHYTRQDGERTDIWRLDPATLESTQVTRTAEYSEYSPTPLPDGTGFSVIRQDAEGTQLLVAHDMDGTSRGPIFETVEPVGYQAWIDAERVAMFILGDPATLQVGRVGAEGAELQVEGIGRSLHAIPGEPGAISFPRNYADSAVISRWRDGEVTPLVTSWPGSDDHAWGNGLVFQADAGRLHVFDPSDPAAGWTQVLDLTEQGVAITRMAIRADGGMIAIVGEITPAEE